MVKRIAANISIPFTVGGGIHELSDVDRLLSAGADKISVNSAAIRRPELIDEIAKHFGSQVCVLAVDAKLSDKGWWCYLNGGRVETDKELFAWVKEAQERGAGEVLFTSMDHDGVKTGMPMRRFRRCRKLCPYRLLHLVEQGKRAFQRRFYAGKSRRCVGCQCFHFGEIKIPELKSYLCAQGIAMRR